MRRRGDGRGHGATAPEAEKMVVVVGELRGEGEDEIGMKTDRIVSDRSGRKRIRIVSDRIFLG